MAEQQEVEFASGGITCRAWHYPAQSDEFESEAGGACVVMAHGFGGTRDAGLQPYAERFAAAGLHVLLFDYRHFGASDGEPRQLLSIARQLDDWAEAIAFARTLAGVDGDRIALWGSSFSGGHVIEAAVRDGNVAAVSAQGPFMDGPATLATLADYAGIGQVLRLTWAGLRDLGQSALGRGPHYIPIVAVPGELAAMASADALSGYTAITPPDWRNEVTARTALALGLYRPGRKAAQLSCPILVLICDDDSVVPPAAAETVARRAGLGSQVEHYAMGHFDIYVGEGFERSSTDQIEFFRKHLTL